MTSGKTGARSNAGAIVAGVSLEKQKKVKLLLPFVRLKKGLPEYKIPEEDPLLAKMCQVAAFVIVHRDVSFEDFWAAGHGKHRDVLARSAWAVICRSRFEVTLYQLRDFLGYECHTTVLYLLQRYRYEDSVVRCFKAWDLSNK